MTKYTDVDALMKDFDGIDLTKCVKYGNEDAEQQHISYSTMMMYEIASTIDDAPAADVVEVVNARWAVAKETESEKLCYCTRCGWLESFSGFRPPELYRLCPSCGAMMDKEES